MTIITPSAAARRKEKNFVIDENLSLVGYVLAVKLNDVAGASVDEELNLRMLRISNEPIRTDDVILDVTE